jgi:hypothetical protein
MEEEEREDGEGWKMEVEGGGRGEESGELKKKLELNNYPHSAA